MKVDTMRKMDRLAGMPLCFLLDLLHRIRNFVTPKKQVQARNVLLIELSEMGSTILADPAMRKLAERKEVALHFVIFKDNVNSLHILNTVPESNIFTLRSNNLIILLIDALSFLFWCRKNNIDTVIDLELFSRFTSLLSGLCGASNRVGFYAFHDEGLYRGHFLTHPVAYNPHMHIAKNFISLVNALMSGKHEWPFSKTIISDEEIRLTQVEIDQTAKDGVREKIKQLSPSYQDDMHRVILINANASELLPQRCWPLENYTILVKLLLEKYSDVFVVITGSPAERKEMDSLTKAINNDHCINSAGIFNFDELIPLYSIATIMITNDSGPAHFSAVTPLRTFVIFGPETPKLYGSLGNSTAIYANMACSPCVSATNHRKTSCTDNQCVKVISPDHVLTCIRAAL